MVLVPLFGGERPPVFRVAWMLATIYVLAVLGYGVSAGGEVASALACTPVSMLACVPVVAAQVSSAGVDRLASNFADESDEWHATMDAWVDGFMRDYAEQRVVDRRVSNGGRNRGQRALPPGSPSASPHRQRLQQQLPLPQPLLPLHVAPPAM